MHRTEWLLPVVQPTDDHDDGALRRSSQDGAFKRSTERATARRSRGLADFHHREEHLVYKDNPILPLQGPTGVRPKAPAVGAWQSPGYKGVGAEPASPDEWLGMRCDGLVVVDCDNEDAAKFWLTHVPKAGTKTWVRKTPRGFHFIYEQTPGSPDAPAAGVWPHIDIRAGRTSQIVMHAPGYKMLSPMSSIVPFDPSWLPEHYGVQIDRSNDESWDEIPEGRGNNTMAAFAGAFRKQGMSPRQIAKCLGAINRICMTDDPMPVEMIVEIAKSVGRYSSKPDIDIEVED